MINKGIVRGAQRCLVAQLIITIMTAVGLLLVYGAQFFQASVYGGLLGMLNTLILARRVNRGKSASGLMRHAQLGLFERWAVVIVFLALAFLKLNLLPFPLILTMALTYLGYFFTDDSQQVSRRNDNK
ncbi:MAG: ATP synthase subunit I [Proteobacteria bacterium]|nr:ATP synthase subunit I [Pseudomonadota bacterium]